MMSGSSLEERKASWREEHRLEQLVAGLDATPAQRLAWLEAAIEFAYRAGALTDRDQDQDRRS